MKYHVLRIGHSEETTIEDVRAGEVIDVSGDHNHAADQWEAEQARQFNLREGDTFDLIVMDEAGRHIRLVCEGRVSLRMRMDECQALGEPEGSEA